MEYMRHGLRPLHGVQGQVRGTLESVQLHRALKTTSQGWRQAKSRGFMIAITVFNDAKSCATTLELRTQE